MHQRVENPEEPCQLQTPFDHPGWHILFLAARYLYVLSRWLISESRLNTSATPRAKLRWHILPLLGANASKPIKVTNLTIPGDHISIQRKGNCSHHHTMNQPTSPDLSKGAIPQDSLYLTERSQRN